jgi:hypothetical protein
MSAQAVSAVLTSQFLPADEQSGPSLGGRLVRLIIAGRPRKTDRRILMYLPTHEACRRDFQAELERRLLGQ